MALVCPKCGVALEDAAAYCSNCDADLSASATEQISPSPNPPVGDGVTEGYAQPMATNTQPVATKTQPAATNTQPVATNAQPIDAPAQPSSPYAATPTAPGVPGAYTGQGTTPMVLGILSIVFAGLIGLVLSILAITKGKKALGFDPNDGRAKAGRITGIIGLVLSILAVIAAIALSALGVFALSDPEVQQSIEQAIEQADTSTASSLDIEDNPSTAAVASSAGSDTSDATTSADAADATTSVDTAILDSFASECFDTRNNPTVYSLLDLDGSQLKTVLQGLGWRWDSFESAWVGTDGAALAVLNADGTPLSDEQVGSLDKGGAGASTIYMLVQPGYSTVDEALAATQVVNEDTFAVDDSSAMAVVYGPSMNEHLAILTVAENEASWLIFSQEAIAEGAIQELLGDIEGSTLNEIWQNVTGRAVGDF